MCIRDSPYSEELLEDFAAHLEYYRMDFSDRSAYEGLGQAYEAMQAASHIFYFAVAPRFFSVIAAGLKTITGLTDGKIIIEKPFGETLASARELNRQLESCFGPDNIYRIDHYLGKEMIRNIQTIRFSNPVFANAWNGKMIEAVEISALEDVGVETRDVYKRQARSCATTICSVSPGLMREAAAYPCSFPALRG